MLDIPCMNGIACSNEWPSLNPHITNMNKQLTPLQSLDAVLTFLAGPWARGKSTDGDLYAMFVKKSQHEMEPGYFLKVLERLVQDKYIHKELQDPFKGVGNTPLRRNYYSINFDGELFHEMGGYAAEAENTGLRKRIEEDRLNRAENTAKRLNRLTFWLVIGTVSLAIIEIIKFLLDR
jgi:hypothetical protein